MASEAQLREESESSAPTPTTYKPWDTARITDGLCARACLLIGGEPFANKKERRVVGWMRFAFEASGVEPHVIRRCPLLESVDAVEPPFGLKVMWNDVRQDVCTAIMRQCYGGYPPPVATGWHPLLSKFRLRSVGKKWDRFGASQKGKGGKKKGKKPAKKKTAAKKSSSSAAKKADAKKAEKAAAKKAAAAEKAEKAAAKKAKAAAADDRKAAAAAAAAAKKAAAVPPDPERAPTEPSSRFWGVCWCKTRRRWLANYRDADGKHRTIGYFNTQEEAARARDQAVRDAGLEGKRHMNAVDATGALVPKPSGLHNKLDRSAVVAPDAARAPTETTSKFWGVTWNKQSGRWQALYKDANGKKRHIGYFDNQEAAAHAVNAAIRRAGLEGRRKTNPVVDGQLVPRARKANGHGPPRKSRKRRRDEPVATRRRPPPPRRRAAGRDAC